MSGSEIALVAPDVGERVRLDARAGTLVGGHCADCGARHWPQRAVCAACGGGVVEARPLPTTGRLTTWSRVWIPVDGIEPPYIVGLIDLDGVAVFAHLRRVVGDPVSHSEYRLVVEDGSVPSFWFEPYLSDPPRSER